MAEEIPVLDFFPGKFKGSGRYEKINLNAAVSESPDYHPFQIVQTGSNKVVVYYGTVNSKVPDEVDVLLTECEEFDVANGDQLWINVDLDMDHFQIVDTVEIVKQSQKYDDALDDKFSILIGEISAVDGALTIAQVVTKNVSTISCGIVHEYTVN